jgi:hypothetical protein
MSLFKLTEKSNFDNLYSKPVCHVVSRAFSISKNTAAEDMLLLKLRVTWSVILIHCKVVLWQARKPNWFAFSRPLSPMCLWTIFGITFSNNLPVVGKRLIGRNFWGNVGSLPGFGKVIIFASFQGVGKWAIRRQWLNKWVKYTKGIFGSCLRHSFGMPSIPHALGQVHVYMAFRNRMVQSKFMLCCLGAEQM